MSIKVDLSKIKVELKNYIEINGDKYYVDGKKVIIEPSKKETHTALWLSAKLNIKIEILPRIILPKNIKTPDYLINGEYWDLKDITSNRNDALRCRIRGKEKQSLNFIIDISKSKLTIKAAERQINILYDIKGYKWLKDVIIKKNNEILIIKKKS